MEAEARWASLVLRPETPVSSHRVRRTSVPAGLYSTKMGLQLDEKPGFLSNSTEADYEKHETNHHHHHHQYAATAGIERRLRACSERACPRGEACRCSTNKKRALSNSFSGGDFVRGESLGKHGGMIRRRTASDDSQGSSSPGTDNSTSRSLTESGKHLYPHRPVTGQVAEEALPGSQKTRRPGSLLRQRERTTARNIDDGKVRRAHNHVSSLLSSSPPSSTATAESRVNAVSDTPHGDSSEAISPRPPSSSANHQGARRRSSAGESASSQVPALGSQSRDLSSWRSRRKSTSVLPFITNASPASNAGMAAPQPPLYSQHGPASRKGPLALRAGGLKSRSLPEEKLDDEEDSSAVHADLLLLTRKKKISTNVSEEYRRALDDLTIAPSKKPTPPVGKRILSKRWSSLQSSVLAKNSGNLERTGGRDQSSAAGSSGEMSAKDGKLRHADDTDNYDRSEPRGRRHRGWQIVRAKLGTIADMAPKDSIDSKPLTFRNIADLVKAREFRLMMKRRASFVENGRFQFDEAKQDLYRRYGDRTAGNLSPTAPSKSHNSRGRKTDGGTGTRVVNRRKMPGLSGSV